ncbi:MAG: MmgE/PrpD family protein [Dehalococcoidales bacterium]|nr:MmgE/PrpD family protein [Dehalococcoidales bacterium]
MDAAYALAKNLATVKYGDIPPDVVEITRKQVLDILGVALGGSSRPGVRELAEIIGEWGGKEESTVLCFGNKVPAPNAAQVNATMGHALDYDDTGDGPTHPSVIIVPTCLAVAERQGKVSGREFIAAVALGTDMMGRLGQAFRSGLKTAPVGGHPGAGWHLTALYGYLAAAGVAGRLLGLDEEKIINALGIAYHQCSGNGQCVTEGALTKRMGPGFSARGGIVAALMAEKGITGAKESLEGEVGLYNLYHRGEYDPVPLTKDLGKTYAGMHVAMKLYPCCKGTHSYVDAALALVDKHKIKPEDVKEITVFCKDKEYFLLHPLGKRSRPENPVDSQFSIPWAVAAVFARGRAGIGEFTEEAIKSSDILDISGRIRVEEDDQLKSTKGMDPAKIGVTTQEGQTYVGQAGGPAGGSGQLPFSAYERKFRDCASLAIKPLADKQVDEVIARIKKLEQLSDIRQLIELLG